MALGLLALAAVAAAHSVELEHGGGRIGAQYHARTEVETRTIGAYAPNRMESRRCLWTATVVVDRQLAGHVALNRTVSRDLQLKGSLAGACKGRDGHIAREVARHAEKVRAHLVAVAEEDRARLVAELDAARSLVSD